MKINNSIYEYANNNKSHMKSLNQSSKNTASDHKNSANSVGGNQSDTLVISEEARNISQLDRANEQHLWVEVNGTKVSTIVTSDGIWMAKNGGIGREAYELIDSSTDVPGVPKSTIQELEQMSKMLAYMPSGQLSVSPGSYGRSVMAEMGIKLSDITGTYTVQELQALKDKGHDLSKLPPKPSLMTAEQLQWLRGDDMAKDAKTQPASLEEILRELVNAFAAVNEESENTQFTEAAFRLMLGKNSGFLGVQLMRMKFTGDAAVTNPAILEKMRIDSERQIDLFGNTFLSSFRKHGAEKAFELAWSKLQQ